MRSIAPPDSRSANRAEGVLARTWISGVRRVNCDLRVVTPATIESVRAFACPVCRGFAAFESHRCPNCTAELGLHVPSRSMVATSSGTAVIDGQLWIACTRSATLGCNWLVPEEQELGAEQGQCI